MRLKRFFSGCAGGTTRPSTGLNNCTCHSQEFTFKLLGLKSDFIFNVDTVKLTGVELFQYTERTGEKRGREGDTDSLERFKYPMLVLYYVRLC